MNNMLDVLIKLNHKPLTLNHEQSIRDLLELWRDKGSINPVGIVKNGALSQVLDRDAVLLLVDAGHDLTVGQLKGTGFASVTTNTTVKEAWKVPEDILAVLNKEGKLLGLITKTQLTLCLFSERKTLSREMDAVLNAAPTGIVVINKQGIIKIFNPAAEKMTRRSRESAIGKPLPEVLIPTGLLDVLNTGKNQFEYRVPIAFSQGTRVYIANRSPIIENGEIIGAISIFHDITEFEFLAKELTIVKELNKELRALIESSYDGIIVTDCQGIIRQANEASIRLIGLKETMIIDHSIKELVAEGHYASLIIENVLKTCNSVTQVNVSPLGNRLLITANPVKNDNGKIFRVVINVRDLTEIENLKQELNESKSLNRRYRTELMTLSGCEKEPFLLSTNSPEMQKTIDLCYRVAQVDVNVLLLGESGVGKEVIAKLIHNCSNRKEGPFIKINCGAIPEALLESELFGYERGAFTGASKEGKAGIFEMANNGTVLLDEIGDLPFTLQVKLLRVLQEKELTRIGGVNTQKINVRFLAATNKDLEQMVSQGSFREDLFFRLKVVQIYIPPLRARKEDIPSLLGYFLDKNSKKYNIQRRLDAETIRIFLEYYWPGNIRELENLIESLYVTSPGAIIIKDYLPPSMKGDNGFRIKGFELNGASNLKEAVLKLEKYMITHAIDQYGNTYKAAASLGIDQSTLVRKMIRIKKILENNTDLCQLPRKKGG
ncbi:MAG: sigma 54-interacting transcriptional regulator [Firmicutes bacterium]|nr:sigma 54-interacting transcriptional regulator [Bacillota bacterium]